MAHELDDVEVWFVGRQELSLVETQVATADQQREQPATDDLPLIIRRPVQATFADRTISLDRQGLYVFHRWARLRWPQPEALPQMLDEDHRFTTVIYFKDDPDALFAGLATLQVHGWVDADLSLEDKIQKMKHGMLSCNCGYIAQIGIHLLTSMGYRARMVDLLRVRGGPYNARDDGHSQLEYFNTTLNQWVLVDIDNHCTFALEGRPLSLLQVADCIHAGRPFEIVPMTLPGLYLPDTTAFVTPQAGRTWLTLMLQSPAQLRRWLQEMMEVPSLTSEGRLWFWHPDEQLAAKAAAYRPRARRLSRSEWMARFY